MTAETTMTATSDMRFFLAVARHESLTAAATDIDLSPSAVSRRLAKIERRLGVRLVSRTTRRTRLTPEGEFYWKESQRILDEIENLEGYIGRSRQYTSGLLRINATFHFGRAYIAPAIVDFTKLYPEIEVQLSLSDTPANLVEDGFDAGIRFGLPPASNVVTKLLVRNRRFMIASPDYLRRRGTPGDMDAVAGHDCIVLRQERIIQDIWRFDSIAGEPSVRVTGPLSTNDGQVAVDWVISGLGIMLRSEWDTNHLIRSSQLKRVLPDYFQTANVHLVVPSKDRIPARTEAFSAFLSKYLKMRLVDFSE